jgi:hypothetical protein
MSGAYFSPLECPFDTISDVLFEIGNQGAYPEITR